MKTRAVTDDEVFYLYERNKRNYDKCELAKRKCPSIYEECYCHLNVNVLPITIGDQDACCNIRVKCYINPQEECSICLDIISKKSNAYLTNCGHAFHKLCFFQMYETNFKQHRPINRDYFKCKCPVCRRQIFGPTFYCRYPQMYVLPKYKNYLDVLEEFWLSKDFKIGQLCYKGNNEHYLGMNGNCPHCLEYRQFGRF